MMPLFRSANRLWFAPTALAIAFLLAGAMLTGCNSSKEPIANARQLEEVQATLKRIDGELSTLTNANAKQMEEVQATLKRINGDLSTLKPVIPQGTEQKLKDIESRLNDRKQWPEDLDGAEKIRKELEEIVKALPPMAAERHLPQIARINWGIEALWTLRNHSKIAPNQLEELQGTFKEVMERHPSGQFTAIHKELENRLKEIDLQVRAFQIKHLLERADGALQGKEDAGPVFSSLEDYRADKEVAKILPKLRAKVLEKSGIELIESLEKKLKKTSSFTDDRERQVSLLTIQEGSLRLMVDLELEDAAPKEVLQKSRDLLARCDKELATLAAKQKDDNARKIRLYQAWALEQIRKFDGPKGWYYDVTLPWIDSELKQFRDATEDKEWVAFQEFDTLQKLIMEKLGVDLSDMKGAMLTAAKRKEIYNAAAGTVGWKNNIHTEIAYRTTRDGMVKFLLPIQPQLLDPPVAQLYQQAFSKGWQKLEGREDQLHVAEQSAKVPKKTIEDMGSSNR